MYIHSPHLFPIFYSQEKVSTFKSSLLSSRITYFLSPTMGEGKRVIFEDPCFDQFEINNVHVMVMEDDQLSSSIGEDDDNDSCTSSSSDITDDASSDSSNPSSYDLSDLMSQLPIKRGLSKFYQGKSQSYTSLSRVTSLEDLAKKQNNPNRKKMMSSCKSYGGGLHTLQKPIISKKSSPKGSFLISRKSSFSSFCKPPPVPVQEKM